MSLFKVTFVSDYFVLHTTIEEAADATDETIEYTANEALWDWCRFRPSEYTNHIEIEEA